MRVTVTLHSFSMQIGSAIVDCSGGSTVQQIIAATVQQLRLEATWQDPFDAEKLIEQVDVVQVGASDLDQADVLFGLSHEERLIVAREDFSNITVADLVRARQAGLIAGELTDIRLHCSGYRGLSLSESWAYFVAALGALKFVADAVQAAKDVHGLSSLFRRRKARRYARRFSAAGIAPRHLVRLIRRRKVWESARLALYLSIPAEEAAQLLVAAGYRFVPEARGWVCQIPEGTRSTLETIIERAEHARVLPGQRGKDRPT